MEIVTSKIPKKARSFTNTSKKNSGQNKLGFQRHFGEEIDSWCITKVG
jgi:hypothetical protein